MLQENDLEAAAAEGIITTEQLEKLRAFAGSKRLAAGRADEERFRFLRGFNDFFFAVGIVLFGVGIAFFAGADPIKNLVAAAIVWALAELLVRRMRLVLPGILLAFLFAYFGFWLTELIWPSFTHLVGLPWPAPLHPRAPSFDPLVMSMNALGAALATTIFYLRFRLPFALFIIAGSLVVFVSTLFGRVFFPGKIIHSLVLLASGFAVFAAAMAYDLADRARTTRYADCAFWLHLSAAPLIVDSLIHLFVPARLARAGLWAPFNLAMTTPTAVTIFIVVAFLTAVALLIDRRALLVSALMYLGVAIGYGIKGTIDNSGDSEPAAVFATFVILGAMVLALGVAWQPLRRWFLRFFPAALTDRHPPSAYPA